ncbi:hypothetical protein BJX76DRAFT_357385 [Aspergillus varians]
MKSRRFPLASLYPPEEWRSLLRSLLRECSYLPDPIARSTCHDQVLRRFRRYRDEPRDHILNNTERLVKLRKEARWSLSVLQRANEGYSRPLEKVLKLAYGRTGRRRVEMLNRLFLLETPTNAEAVAVLVAAPTQFTEGWSPPKVIVDLLSSQKQNPFIAQISDRPSSPKAREPPVSVKNAWGRKMPLCRRNNIRRRWYNSVLEALLPPLPDSELKVLNGLISGDIPWNPPRRRSKGLTTSSADVSSVDTRGGMIRKLLTDGPQKEGTFAPYKNGRPHKITRRFMSRLWQRISCIIPRHRWNAETGKHVFEWDTATLPPQLAHSAKEGSSQEIFGDLDTEITLRRPPKAKELTNAES